MDIPGDDDLHPGGHRLRHLGRLYRADEYFLRIERVSFFHGEANSRFWP
jgi:hypothetical protein